MKIIDADALFESLIFPTEQFKTAFKQILDDAPAVDPSEYFKGMTNGEVFDSIIDVDNDCVEVYGKNGLIRFTFSQEWWNARHKTKKEMNNSENPRNKGDLISRQAVINAIANTCFWLSGNDWNELIECIDSIPAAENKEDWIPVSSGELPKIGQRVLATIESLDDGRTVRETTYDKYGFLCGNGVAWMPLPEPYKPEKGGE